MLVPAISAASYRLGACKAAGISLTSQVILNRFERQLIELTRHELNGHAEFTNDSSFILRTAPFPGDYPLGLYELPRRSGDAHLYRLGHPLAEHLIAQAKSHDLPLAEIEFRYAEHGSKISILEGLRGQSGWLIVSLFTVESLDQAEAHLLFAACTDDEPLLTEDQARRLLTLPASVRSDSMLPLSAPPALSAVNVSRQAEIQRQRNDKRRSLFEAQDAIDKQREELIGKIEGKLQQAAGLVSLFTLRWVLP